MKITELFPTPVGVSLYNGNINKEFVNSLELRKLPYNSGTVNTDVLSLPELKDLKDFIEKELNEYFNSVYNPKNDVEIYVTQSWINFTQDGEAHHSHNHPNSIISGVFYIDVEDDRIEFERPFNAQTLLTFPPKKYNQYNSGSWWLGVEEKSLLLFPSTLVHSVPQIHHEKTRISLAFNTFVKGYIGDDEALIGIHL